MGPPFADLNRLPVGTRLGLPLLAGLCTVMLALGSLKESAGAAEWSAEPSLSVKGEYNSNLLLTNGNNQVWGYWVNPGLKFKGSTEALDVEGGARGQFVHYYGDNEREYTNLFFPIKTLYRLDRHRLGFEGGFTRDNTLRGELQQTGFVLAFTQRNMWTAMPSWTVGVTERLSWHNSYHFTDVQYQNGLRFGLVDYQVHGGTTGLSYNLGLLDQVQLTGEYTVIRTPFIRQHSMYYGVQGGWTHDFGNDITGSLSGGVRLVNTTQEFSGGSLTARDTVWVYRASLAKKFERTTALIEISRDLNPSGFGRLLQTDRLGTSLSHNLSETITASLNGNLYFVDGIATNASSAAAPQSRFSSISPNLSWKFSPWWTVDVAYTYAERTIDSLDQWNVSHSTFLMLTYGGAKWSVSR